jgi:hypothetical protein
MSIDWKTAYDSALLEQDPAKIAEACEHVRILLEHRAVELLKEGKTFDSPERQALDEALRELWIFEHKSR